MTPTAQALALVDELVAMRRLTSVEQATLTRGLRATASLSEARDWLLPVDFTPSGMRSWVLTACEAVSTTPTALARLAGVAPSTLNRLIAQEDGDASLSANTLAQLIAALQALASKGSEDVKGTSPKRFKPIVDGPAPRSMAEIIARFGNPRLSALLDVPYGTVTSWRARNQIPARFWLVLVAEAERLGIPGVTLEFLAHADAAREPYASIDSEMT